MHFVRDRANRTIAITQQAKIAAILNELDMQSCAPTKLPADPKIMLSKDMSLNPEDAEQLGEMAKVSFKSIVGKLLYLVVTTRPDIAPAVSACGR